MLFSKYTEVQFHSIFFKWVAIEDAGEVDPLWMDEGVIDERFDDDIIEAIEVGDYFCH